MNVDIINPFITATFNVLEMVLGEAPAKGEISTTTDGHTAQQVNIHVGVTGQVVGHIIYGMSQETAGRIASLMIGMPIQEFDELASSAIAELSNMISGNALLGLSESGATSDLTPPSIIQGMKVQISTLSIPAVVVPFTVPQGELTVTLALQRVK